jgi:hypothetical protein
MISAMKPETSKHVLAERTVPLGAHAAISSSESAGLGASVAGFGSVMARSLSVGESPITDLSIVEGGRFV